MELPIRGMEMALNCSTASCIGSMMDEELREVLGSLKVQIGQKFERARCSMPIDATITLLETKEQFLDMYLWKFRNISITQENLSAFFFLYSLELLLDDLPIAQVPECALEYTQNIDTEEYIDSQNQAMGSFNRTWSTLDIFPTSQSLVFAFKCSLSLGLAVLFGLMYNKENGYWSGLTIAISFVTGRQATFTAANARAQGTAMGSVYGILCCYIFQRFEDLRFLAMLPWIIFTNFLMHSRMYGQAGGISAVIGALSILGRTNYTSPSEFAIARISEACIGLICFLIVEILLNPARAATLAKTELSRTLGALQDWINSIVLCSNQKNMPASTLQALREKQNKLKTHFNDLKKFISEAGLEPNFWFLPFHGPCYGKLLESLSKMLDLTSFVTYKIEFLSQVLKRFALDLNELQERMNDDLELFKERVGSSLKHLEKATSIKSLAALEKELQKKVMSQDIELGNSPNVNAFRLFGTDEEEVENIMSSFLRHLNEEADKIYAKAIEEKLKSQIVLCLTGLSFCIGCLIRETMEIEKEVKELVKWENPKNHVWEEALKQARVDASSNLWKAESIFYPAAIREVSSTNSVATDDQPEEEVTPLEDSQASGSASKAPKEGELQEVAARSQHTDPEAPKEVSEPVVGIQVPSTEEPTTLAQPPQAIPLAVVPQSTGAGPVQPPPEGTILPGIEAESVPSSQDVTDKKTEK
ncbi:uncharacterized protein LOC115951901 [Quercus lobata]|uniref:uncharacterized protein LOC115951901 n=1 Tax=Quercus lobata TaxID=97700 RepID=UPI001247CA2F|nr:uncharacterized protein LOC115951901 [Quercus lobata]